MKQIKVYNLSTSTAWDDEYARIISKLWLNSEEAIFLAERSRTPLVLNQHIDDLKSEISFTYYATLDEADEIIWRLKFK